MKVFIIFFLIFSFFNNGIDAQSTNATSTSTTSSATSSATAAPTTTSSTTAAPTTTSSATAAPTTTSTSTIQSTTTLSTPSPTTTTSPLSPSADISINVTWTFNSGTKVTSVIMTITNLKASQWAAIGLGQNQTMGQAHVFICQRSPTDTISIGRYINPGGHDPPEDAGSEQGGVFTPLHPQFMNGVVVCQFTLSNFTTQTFKQANDLQPLSQSRSYYPLLAIGPLESDANDIGQHYDDSHVALADTVQLSQTEFILYKVPTGPGDSMTYFQAHGIIMVFAWIFFVSTGVLLSRYFKKSWPSNLVCGKPVWFSGHRLLMSIAVVLTILGFLFILVAKEGAWVSSQYEAKHFIHTVTGALVIGLAFFQPFIALFRCDPDSRYRFIFNYLHAFVGFSAFILSIATIFLATYFELFKDGTGRTVMTVWTVWIILIFILFEVIQHYMRTKYGYINFTNVNSSNKTSDETDLPPSSSVTLSRSSSQQETTYEDKIKNILLATHIFIAAILSIYMSTLIG